jgi:hypothetical protein
MPDTAAIPRSVPTFFKHLSETRVSNDRVTDFRGLVVLRALCQAECHPATQ